MESLSHFLLEKLSRDYEINLFVVADGTLDEFEEVDQQEKIKEIMLSPLDWDYKNIQYYPAFLGSSEIITPESKANLKSFIREHKFNGAISSDFNKNALNSFMDASVHHRSISAIRVLVLILSSHDFKIYDDVHLFTVTDPTQFDTFIAPKPTCTCTFLARLIHIKIEQGLGRKFTIAVTWKNQEKPLKYEKKTNDKGEAEIYIPIPAGTKIQIAVGLGDTPNLFVFKGKSLPDLTCSPFNGVLGSTNEQLYVSKLNDMKECIMTHSIYKLLNENQSRLVLERDTTPSKPFKFRIGFFGHSGVGKSAFINAIGRAFGITKLTDESNSNLAHTQCVEIIKHLGLPFELTDIFGNELSKETDYLSALPYIVSGQLSDRCPRGQLKEAYQNEDFFKQESQLTLRDCLHGAIMVVSAKHLDDEHTLKTMKDTYAKLQMGKNSLERIQPIIVLTFLDTLISEDLFKKPQLLYINLEVRKRIQIVADYFGCLESRIFPLIPKEAESMDFDTVRHYQAIYPVYHLLETMGNGRIKSLLEHFNLVDRFKFASNVPEDLKQNLTKIQHIDQMFKDLKDYMNSYASKDDLALEVQNLLPLLKTASKRIKEDLDAMMDL